MGKKGRSRQRKNRRRKQKRYGEKATLIPETGLVWMDEDKVHAILPGKPPPPEFLEVLTENFQQQIRNSPLWDEMVSKFGEKEAEKLLKQCRAKIGAK